MQIVRIVWIDSQGRDGWQEREYIDHWARRDDSGEAISVGYLIAETETFLTLAATLSGTQYCGVIKLPRFAVQNLEVLRETEPPQE